jgi:hypothetical protein
MPQNLRLEFIQSLFLVNDGKSAAFVPQNSNGATDGRRTTDRPSYPNLLRSQMGYIILFSTLGSNVVTGNEYVIDGTYVLRWKMKTSITLRLEATSLLAYWFALFIKNSPSFQ